LWSYIRLGRATAEAGARDVRLRVPPTGAIRVETKGPDSSLGVTAYVSGTVRSPFRGGSETRPVVVEGLPPGERYDLLCQAYEGDWLCSVRSVGVGETVTVKLVESVGIAGTVEPRPTGRLFLRGPAGGSARHL
jgi:hypothetical protein